MVIDYVIEFPCEPKRRLRSPGLLTLLRRIERCQDGRPAGKLEAAEAREAEFRVRPLAFHCARCPANHRREAFGCYGRIQGPISTEGEEWLGSLLPVSLKPREESTFEQQAQVTALRELLSYLQEKPVSRKSAEQQRSKQGLLERKGPVQRQYGTLFRPQPLGTSQLLSLLIPKERLQPELGELVCRALGVWMDGCDGDDGIPEVQFTVPVEPDDDVSVVDLKQYFLAILVASSVNAPIRLIIDEEPGA
jgi:hypothetical protein